MNPYFSDDHSYICERYSDVPFYWYSFGIQEMIRLGLDFGPQAQLFT